MKTNSKIKSAILIGALCGVSYFAVYVSRNILGAVSPQMLESGFTEEYIGTASSVFFIVYAIGQLINGFIGDKIKARYMMSLGLALAGICNIVYPFIPASNVSSIIVYGITGFFLAMIYGPMTKVIAENVEPEYVARCGLGYEFGALLGTPTAGLMAAIFPMLFVFGIGGGMLLIMGIVAFVSFLVLEKKGVVSYGKYESLKIGGKANVKVLLKHRIVKFCFIAVITGVVRTSVVFWLPTYISQYLGFSSEISATIFSAVTLVISLTAFLAVFIYERLKSMDKSILLLFSVAAVAFLMVWLIKQPIVNIVCLIIAIMGSGCVSAIMWCRYCPSLRDTGMVSGVTGFLDFLSYMAAAAANLIFANAVSEIGWGKLIFIWFALMIVGILVSLPYRAILNKFRPKQDINI